MAQTLTAIAPEAEADPTLGARNDPRLAMSALVGLPAAIARPKYDRRALMPGIVHFGPGAFHRAHQAACADAVLRADPRWAIRFWSPMRRFGKR